MFEPEKNEDFPPKPTARDIIDARHLYKDHCGGNLGHNTAEALVQIYLVKS